MNIIVSDLKVMRSAAGFYVGRGYYDPEMMGDKPVDAVTQEDMCLPYERCSGYFPSAALANEYLEYCNE